MTTVFYKAVILQGEIGRLSLLGLKGLTEKLTRLFLLKEVKPSLQSKNDKTSNFFLITCFRSYNCTLSLKPTVGKFVFQYFIKTNLIGGALWE